MVLLRSFLFLASLIDCIQLSPLFCTMFVFVTSQDFLDRPYFILFSILTSHVTLAVLSSPIFTKCLNHLNSYS